MNSRLLIGSLIAKLDQFHDRLLIDSHRDQTSCWVHVWVSDRLVPAKFKKNTGPKEVLSSKEDVGTKEDVGPKEDVAPKKDFGVNHGRCWTQVRKISRYVRG